MKTVSNLTVGHRGSGVAVAWRWRGGGVAQNDQCRRVAHSL